MRTMRWSAIALFAGLLGVVLALAWVTAWYGVGRLAHLGEFKALLVSATAILLTYAYGMLVHRICRAIAPLREGRIGTGTGQEFAYQVHSLFYLLLFNTLIRSKAIPIPFMRLVYLALGARLGSGTYCAGTIFDPVFVTIGADTLVGEAALLVPHVIEGSTLGHYAISIGKQVTIGAHAIILAGVMIGDDAIVAAGSVVLKGASIPAGEIWGGSPARRLRVADGAKPSVFGVFKFAARRTAASAGRARNGRAIDSEFCPRVIDR